MAWPVTEDLNNPPHYPLATDKARYQGDGVAVVVADVARRRRGRGRGRRVDYDPLPAVVDMRGASERRRAARPRRVRHEPVLHLGERPTETSTGCSPSAGRRAGALQVHQRQSRTRWSPARSWSSRTRPSGQFTMWSSTQVPHILRTAMAIATGIPESKLRIVAPRVGGGFGSKLQVYPEEALALELARRLAHADQVDRRRGRRGTWRRTTAATRCRSRDRGRRGREDPRVPRHASTRTWART